MKKYRYRNRFTNEIKETDELVNGNEWLLTQTFHKKPITKYHNK